MTDRGRETGLEYANVEAIRARIRDLGWSQAELASVADVDAATISRMLNHGVGVSRPNAHDIAAALDGPVAHYFQPRRRIEPDRLFQIPNTEEWAVEEILTEVTVAPNGVRFQVCQMRHRFLPNRRGRGKYYSLAGVRSAEKPNREQMLSRHAVVSSRVGVHPNVAENLSTVPTLDGLGWWVVDRWVNGSSLEGQLESSSLLTRDVPRLASDMLAGLKALHDQGIVFRELAPARIVLADDGRAVLTDFELAKLIDGSPTVKPAVWKDELYRAPELDSGVIDGRADLYSWARVLTHVVLGELPPPNEAATRIAQSRLPRPIRNIITRCLDIESENRPGSVSEVSHGIERWT